MYQALYRKYRPSVFDDVVGQEHITETIKNSLRSGKVFHAYLFTGTRGTGKTTCAKILANALCCENPVDGEPCGKCAACLSIRDGSASDISEIDAASNNGVNDVRELREQVHFLPVALKKRVYIIDEVHMLTTQAFNALLKTLEEPPAHVVFILATTEVHKLPATILSRCQRFDFHRIEPDTISAQLKKVAASEGFNLEDNAALKIAALADGGMRDALSILDQCSSVGGDVTLQVIEDVCGVAGEAEIAALLEAISRLDTANALQIVDQLYRNSTDMKRLVFELISCFRNLLIIKTVKNPKGLIVCSEDELSALKNTADSFTLAGIIRNISLLQSVGDAMSVAAAKSQVELAVVKLCTPELSPSNEALTLRVEALEKALNSLKAGKVVATETKAEAVTAVPKPAPETKPAKAEPVLDIPPLPEEPPVKADAYGKVEEVSEKPQSAEVPKAVPKAPAADGEPVLVEKWPEIMALVKKSCPLMAGVLAGSKAYIGSGRLLIDSELDQFKELINSEPKYRNYIKNAAEQVLGVSYNLGPYKRPTPKAEKENDPLKDFVNSLNNL